MTSQSKIEWTGPTLNTVAGCTPQGPECDNCYADDDCHRFAKSYTDRPGLVIIRGPAKKPGLTWLPTDRNGKSLGKGAKWTGEMRCLPHKMLEPLSTAEGDYWFANSVSDLFHRTLVGDTYGLRYIAANLGLFAITPQHRYQILTKQPEFAELFFRLWAVEAKRRGLSTVELCVRELIAELRRAANASVGTPWADKFINASLDVEARWVTAKGSAAPLNRRRVRAIKHHAREIVDTWPLPNVHLGVSVGLAATKHRIDALRRMDAAVRFISFEPLLGDLGDLDLTGIDWAIFGGESGTHARPCELEWIERGVAQAQAQGVAVFVKQLGRRPFFEGQPWPINDAKGALLEDWPERLRVREMPRV